MSANTVKMSGGGRGKSPCDLRSKNKIELAEAGRSNESSFDETAMLSHQRGCVVWTEQWAERLRMLWTLMATGALC